MVREAAPGPQGARAKDALQRHVQTWREPRCWHDGRRRGRRRCGGGAVPAGFALPHGLLWKEGAHQRVQAWTQEARRGAHNLLDEGQGGVAEQLILAPALPQCNLDQSGVRLQLDAGRDLRERLQDLCSSGRL